MAKTVGTHLSNGIRGALIGTAEVVPGISGGTVALIVGIYERLITSAGHVVSAIRKVASDLPRGRGGARAAAELRQVDWALIVAVLIGMVAAALTAARFLAPLIEEEQQRAYGFFFGLVLASLWVPYSSTDRTWKVGNYALALVVAAIAFVLTGLPPAQVEPSPLVVMAAAAVAICALALPGMSGSFVLLTLGLYTVTMNAVNTGDLGYIATFAAGAILGLAFFVKLLQWLLEHRRHITLVVLTGLMAGTLRALWPWQDAERTIFAPSGDIPVTVAFMVAGFAIVAAALVVERRIQARNQATSPTNDHRPGAAQGA